MKNLSLVLNIVLVLAVGYLFIAHFSGKKGDESGSGQISQGVPGEMHVAYIQIDSLLVSYNLYNELREQFNDNQQRMGAELDQKSIKLQRDAADLQQKMENRLITQRQAEAKQKELMDAQQNLLLLRDQLTQKLAMSEQIMNKQVYDSVYSYLNDLNAQRKYNIIFSTTQGGSILMADSLMDITAEVIKGLNERYNGK
jgi:outer membrane protein